MTQTLALVPPKDACEVPPETNLLGLPLVRRTVLAARWGGVLADALSRRDFIWLVLILSLFGKASWFLVLAAAGAPLYFFVLTAIALAERRHPRSAS